MLEMRPSCECCRRDLPAESQGAFICSFECTFCSDCTHGALSGHCPNCGGELLARPTRGLKSQRVHPASQRRVERSEPCA